MRGDDGMTVGELVAVLQGFDQSKRVLIDGCDCCAPATAVVLDDGRVMITREDVEYQYPIGDLVRGGVCS